jgi:AraC-like DNA-binding protein
MSLSILNVLDIITALVGFLYAFQVGTLKKTKVGEHKIFAAFFVCLSVITILFLLIDLKIKGLAMYLIPFIAALPLLLAPLLWLYISRLVQVRSQNSDFRHYFSAILIFCLVVLVEIFTFSTTSKSSKEFWGTILTYLTLGSITVVFILQNIFYIYRSLVIYKHYRKSIQEVYSFIEGVDLSWLRVLVVGYLLLVIGMVGIHFIPNDISNYIFNFLILVFFMYTGHNAMKQSVPEFIEEKDEFQVSTEGVDLDESKQKQVQLFEEIKEKLLAYMQLEKPYLNSDLTINQLSKELSTNSKYLSTIINQDFGVSFVQFINDYRIKEAQVILLENKHLTIEAQCQMVGFKSKSSFNAAFKKNTGMTPSTFIQEHHTRLSNNK